MGSTFSKTPEEEASGPPQAPEQQQHQQMAVVVAQTPAPKKRGPGRPRKAPGTVSRASRRTAKSNPSKVIIKSVAKKKTPGKRKFPLTPETRVKGRLASTEPAVVHFPGRPDSQTKTTRPPVEKKTMPILRKSSRMAKYKADVPNAGSVNRYSPGATYEIDEFVFAWSKGALIEAKVLNSSRNDGKVVTREDSAKGDLKDTKYLVHFLGTKEEEWLTIRDMLKVGYDENKYFKKLNARLADFDEAWTPVKY